MNISKVLLAIAVILLVIGALLAGGVFSSTINALVFIAWGLVFGFGSFLV